MPTTHAKRAYNENTVPPRHRGQVNESSFHYRHVSRERRVVLRSDDCDNNGCIDDCAECKAERLIEGAGRPDDLAPGLSQEARDLLGDEEVVLDHEDASTDHGGTSDLGPALSPFQTEASACRT